MANPPVFAPASGATIKGVSKTAVEMAQELERDTGGQQNTITLIFSGVSIPVKSTDEPADIVQTYNDEYARLAQKFAEKSEPIAKGKQTQVNLLVEMLDDVIPLGDRAVMKWVGSFNPLSGVTGVDVPRDEICAKLTAAGYISDEYKDDGNKERIEGNRTIMGRYIVGQVISHLEGQKPMDRYIDRLLGMYNAMPDPSAVPQAVADAPEVAAGSNVTVMRALSFKPKK